jgi:hypothetical protein
MLLVELSDFPLSVFTLGLRHGDLRAGLYAALGVAARDPA